MIVTIDGPAGAGKSSAAKALAKRLGFDFLDTGAMYRAVALAAMQRDVPTDDPDALGRLAGEVRIELRDDSVLLDGQDVTDQIRSPEVTEVVHRVADVPEVRRRLVELQRKLADGRDFVTEGRDQGSVAFPNAACKIFLTASAEERAARRARQLAESGRKVDHAEVLRQQNDRDRRDANRKVGRLQKAPDAVEVLTDGLAMDEVVDRIERLVRDRQAKTP